MRNTIWEPVRRAAALVALILLAGCAGEPASTAGGPSGTPSPAESAIGGWRVVAAPSGGAALDDVACVSSGDCWAVGGAADGLVGVIIEHEVHGTWTLLPSGQSGQLNGITCLTSGVCWAVGQGPHGPLVETYTTGGWRIVDAPNPGDDYWLNDVACSTSDD